MPISAHRGRVLSAAALVLIHGLAAAAGLLYDATSPVYSLRPYQLDAVRAQPGTIWIVEAYASWCGHCQAFAPVFEAVARNVTARVPSVRFGGIDCAIYTDACIGLGVDGYPTLFVWGARTLDTDSASVPVVHVDIIHSARDNGGDTGDAGEADEEEEAEAADQEPDVSQDGAPMHVGGFHDADAVLTWLLPQLPQLHAQLDTADAAASFLSDVVAANTTAVVVWPDAPAVDATAQRLAWVFGTRSLVAALASPPPTDVLEALHLPANSYTAQVPGSPHVMPGHPQPPGVVVIYGARIAAAPNPKSPQQLPSPRPGRHVGPPPPPPLFERMGAKEWTLAGIEAWLDARLPPPPPPAAPEVEPLRPLPADGNASAGGGGAGGAGEDGDVDFGRGGTGVRGVAPVSLLDVCGAVRYGFEHEVPLTIAASPGHVLSDDDFEALHLWVEVLALYLPGAENRAELGEVRRALYEEVSGDKRLTLDTWRGIVSTLRLQTGADDGAVDGEQETTSGGDETADPEKPAALGGTSGNATGLRRALEAQAPGAPVAASSVALSEGAGGADRGALGASPVTWRQCAGSKPYLRGYPCSLWLLFHTLQMNAPAAGAAKALTAIHEYVARFFGCLECRAHFLVMAGNLTTVIADGISHEVGVFWLWQAHNSVNFRLNTSRGASNDPEHPKLQYPPWELCPTCRNPSGVGWEPSGIYMFLRSVYCSTEEGFECAKLPEKAAEKPLSDSKADARAIVVAIILAVSCCLLGLVPWLCRERCANLFERLEQAGKEDELGDHQFLPTEEARSHEAPATEYEAKENAIVEAHVDEPAVSPSDGPAAGRTVAPAGTPTQGGHADVLLESDSTPPSTSGGAGGPAPEASRYAQLLD